MRYAVLLGVSVFFRNVGSFLQKETTLSPKCHNFHTHVLEHINDLVIYSISFFLYLEIEKVKVHFVIPVRC